MKFLCIPCDEPMELSATNPPDRGPLSLAYRCPACAHEIAMLTNRYETEVVGSMGVKIGGMTDLTDAVEFAGDSKCPSAKITDGVEETVAKVPSQGGNKRWTPEALKRLENIPEFVRPMARKGIEQMAEEKHYSEISEQVMDEAKDLFGM
jgi:hypothetical protein